MRVIVVILLTCALSACGFHLRGTDHAYIKVKKVYLQGGSGWLREQISEALYASSASLTNNSKSADLLIKVSGERLRSRYVSFNASGRFNEKELNYRFYYETSAPGRGQLQANQTIQIIREYFSEQQNILAISNEENVIRQEIYRQAANTLLERAQTQLQTKAR